MEPVVVLLCGVNVGDRQLNMAPLRIRLTEIGCTGVRTYIQSGNIVLTPPDSAPADLRGWLETNISAFAAFDVPVIIRGCGEINRTVADNPYPRHDIDNLHVSFFADPIADSVLDDINAEEMAPETWRAAGPDVYMLLANGFGRAKLPAAVAAAGDRAKLTSTQRSWRVVTTLAKMAREPAPVKSR